MAKFQADLLINAASHLHIAHILFNISAELSLSLSLSLSARMHSDSRGTRVIILHNAATWFFSLPPPPPPSPGQRGGATLRETYACKLITLGYLCIPLRAIIIAPRFMKVRAGETATRFALRTANNLRDGVSRVSKQEYSSPPPYSRNRFSDKSLSLCVSLVRNRLLVSHFAEYTARTVEGTLERRG